MARKRKLVTSASCVAQGACAENAIDRFSNLPDEVAYRILSFLTFKDLTRVGAVSKRCRQFHLSVPLVSFDSSCTPHRVTNRKLVRLMSSLDRYLFYRGDNRMQVFRISWSFFTSEPASKLSDDQFRVFTWIHNAVRWNVEELYLYLSDGDINTIALPSCIFLSQSLRSLSVQSYDVILEAPSLSFSSNLHYLKLEHVKVADERFFKWISRSCKFIKELKLVNIQEIQNITVESSSLEYFLCWIDDGVDCFHLNISGKKLESIDISWMSYESTSIKSLKIFAPNLKNLKWEGSLKHSQNLGKFMNLEKLEILLNSWGNEVDKVCEFLGSVCCAEVLTINEETMKVLFEEGSMSAPLDNIRKFCVHCSGLKDDLVPAMVSLVRGMPNLNILHIKTDNLFRGGSGIGIGYWKSQNLAFVHQLKEVTMEISTGSNEIEFARYILEHAQNLKKMVVVLFLHHGEEESKVLAGMVSGTKKISDATIVIRSKRAF